jgi:SAM-dependent methyltransferase
VWLAERGFQVLAVDLSVEGLRRTRERAAAGGLPVWPVLADAGRVQVRPGSMAVAVNTRFLLRSALALLRSALAPGGILLFETFHADELDLLGGDLRRAFVLERGELLEAFGDWEILLHEEGVFVREEGERGLGRLVARKPGGAGRG